MKKKLLSMAFISLLAAAAFSSCNNDDGDGNGDDPTGAAESTTIAADVESFGDVAFDSIVAVANGPVTVGSGAYSSGKVTVTLDATVGSAYLSKISDEIPAGITVSNPDVKGAHVSVYVYNSGDIAGELSYGTAECDGGIIYVDGDVSVDGSSEEDTKEGIPFTISFSLNLKKGWNVVYTKTSGTNMTVTTTAPQGVKWRYTPGNPNSEEYDELKVVVYDDENSEIVVGSATFVNGELTLPTAEVSSACLSELGDDMPPGVTVSNHNVKGAWGTVQAYKSGSKTGEFLHGVADWVGIIIYVDGDVSISGSYTEDEIPATISLSLDLKKGWNIAYAQYSEESVAMTTTVPEGAEWHLITQDVTEEPATTPESLKAQKALAKRRVVF